MSVNTSFGNFIIRGSKLVKIQVSWSLLFQVIMTSTQEHTILHATFTACPRDLLKLECQKRVLWISNQYGLKLIFFYKQVPHLSLGATQTTIID